MRFGEFVAIRSKGAKTSTRDRLVDLGTAATIDLAIKFETNMRWSLRLLSTMSIDIFMFVCEAYPLHRYKLFIHSKLSDCHCGLFGTRHSCALPGIESAKYAKSSNNKTQL